MLRELQQQALCEAQGYDSGQSLLRAKNELCSTSVVYTSGFLSPRITSSRQWSCSVLVIGIVNAVAAAP